MRHKKRAPVKLDAYDLQRVLGALKVLNKMYSDTGIAVIGDALYTGEASIKVSFDAAVESYVVEWNH